MAPGTFSWAAIAQGPRGEAPVEGLGEAEELCRRCLQILLTKLDNFAQFTSWFLTSMFHNGGLSESLGAKPPSPCLGPSLLLIHIYKEMTAADCHYH